jgi:SAM-dependent methyltransferase
MVYNESSADHSQPSASTKGQAQSTDEKASRASADEASANLVTSSVGEGRADDDGNDDDASSFDSDYSSVSVDELPPICAYGHTYHGSGNIFTPNDDFERQRLNKAHLVYKLCLDGNLVAAKLPLDKPLSIMDVGTGSGIWAVEMADAFPLAQVTGMDISAAMLPTKVPPNVVFEVGDVLGPWPQPLGSLDFVHMRNLVGGGIPDWKQLLQKVFDQLKPGGQMEFTDARNRWYNFKDCSADATDSIDGSGPSTPTRNYTVLDFEKTFAHLTKKLGVDYDPIPKISDILAEVGFEKVVELSDLVPVRSWGPDEKTRRKGSLLSDMVGTGKIALHCL